MIVPIAKNKVSCLISLSSLIGILLWVAQGQHLTLSDVSRSVTGAVTISGFLVLLFDQWLWRWVPEWISGTPDLRGTWKGKGSYKWKSEEDGIKEGAIDQIYLSIDQTFSNATITVHTEQSSSTSLPCNFYKDAGGVWVCLYAYDNNPKLRHLQESRPHRGAGQLAASLVGRDYRLVLEYWTDRWTQGTVTFEQWVDTVTTNYEAAKHEFGGAA